MRLDIQPRSISRRRALGIAAAGVAGSVGAALAIDRLAVPTTPAATNPARWASPLGGRRGLAAHLLRRSGFAYTTADLDRAAALSYDDLVDRVVSEVAAPLPEPTTALSHTAFSAAWYEHMATTAAQFPERMTLFWHGVLTSDYRNAGPLPLVQQQNALYRGVGLSELRTVLRSVTRDPLMMRYLNLDSSTAASPNENFARELMELFTLGPGSYTETDVREAARALSGLRIQLFDASGTRLAPPHRDPANRAAYGAQIDALVRSGARFTGVLIPRLHDTATKTILGRTGNLGPDDVVDVLLSRPECAPFVTRRAMTFFATPAPSTSDVAAVATQFRRSGYDMRTLMRAIFRSEAFTAPSGYRSLLRSPADYMVATMRVLRRPQLARLAVGAAAGMDQVLYDPPDVGGWPANAGWVSSSALLARLNFATAALAQTPMLADPAEAVDTQLDGVLSGATSAAYHGAASRPDRWFALLAGPEFQLK